MLVVSTVHAAYNKNLWPLWEVNNPLSKETISHQQWQQFLNNNLITNAEKINVIDYPNISFSDKKRLDDYLERMAKIDIGKYNRDEQLAYWLNVYNAITVKVVSDHYPLSNIQDINISPGLFSVGPWGANLITINKIPLSLEGIHNRIIRPIWNDPRTHYALNNGTIGAPNLNKQVYKGATIDNQLNKVAREYINSLRGVQIIDDKLIASKIYDWFEEDFGGNKQLVIRHLKLFANPKLKKQLKKTKTINAYIYNWHLNTTHSH